MISLLKNAPLLSAPSNESNNLSDTLQNEYVLPFNIMFICLDSLSHITLPTNDDEWVKDLNSGFPTVSDFCPLLVESSIR